MTPERIKELRALCEKATNGPWTVQPRGNSEGSMGFDLVQVEDGLRGQFANWTDAEFIAASRTALPALLDEVERYHKLLDACRVVRKRIGDVAINGWSMERFLAEGSVREICEAMRGDV
jgi:hypothetical protein